MCSGVGHLRGSPLRWRKRSLRAKRLDFGDFCNVASDLFIRADFNLAQVETIRGGSASTFASNSPGGILNLISKTGEVEGGAIQISSGLDYDSRRLNFDYGGKISDTLRFHLGGFSVIPQYDSRRFTVGAYVVGNASSYTQDINQLKLPGYMLVNPFVQFRPVDSVQVMVSANNVFNALALIEVSQTSLPTNGVGWGRAANGRTVLAAVRYQF